MKFRDCAPDFVEELFAFFPPMGEVGRAGSFGGSGENEVANFDVIDGAAKS